MLSRRVWRVLIVVEFVGCSLFCTGREAQPLDDAKLRSWANAELIEGQRVLSAREPALAERIRLAGVHFANAEAVLVLPRDARKLAEVHVWLGIAQMQLAQAERAREHFQVARGLFGSVRANTDVEAVNHLLRNAR